MEHQDPSHQHGLGLTIMSKMKMTLILPMVAFLCVTASAQLVSTSPPDKWNRADSHTISELMFLAPLRGVQLSHNTPEAIQNEFRDAELIRTIGKASGLSEHDLGAIMVVPEPSEQRATIYQIGDSDKGYAVIIDGLREYVRGRQEGHTKSYMVAAFTNVVPPSAISDPDLRVLVSQKSHLPVSWLEKGQSGTRTNKAGVMSRHTITVTVVDGRTVTNEFIHIPKVDELCRWVSYNLADGEISWRYIVQFKADGSLEDICEIKCDAKEVDPQYQKVIKEVEGDVRAEMKKNGSSGNLGSVHIFWELKKEKLKSRGIEWRSPAECNRSICFD